MKKNVSLLLTALVIIPTMASCMDTATYDLPYLRNADTQKTTRLGACWGYVRNMVYPKVNMPVIETKNGSLEDLIKNNYTMRNEISSATLARARTRRLTFWAGLTGLVGMSAYAFKNGMPAHTIQNGIKTIATVLGGLCTTNWIIPHVNNWWNQRVIRKQQREVRNLHLITPDNATNIKANVYAGDDKKTQNAYAAIIAAMTYKAPAVKPVTVPTITTQAPTPVEMTDSATDATGTEATTPEVTTLAPVDSAS